MTSNQKKESVNGVGADEYSSALGCILYWHEEPIFFAVTPFSSWPPASHGLQVNEIFGLIEGLNMLPN